MGTDAGSFDPWLCINIFERCSKYAACNSQSAAYERGESVQNQYIFLQVMILQSDGQLKRSK